MEFYIKDDPTSIQIGKNVYRRVSIPIDDFNAACDHYGFVKERTCKVIKASRKYVLSDGTELFEDGCSECNGYVGDGDNYCPNCGAKVIR